MSGASETWHQTPIRIYYEDTDTGGIVYYANYLKFAERARSELLRDLGFDNSSILAQKGVAIAVRRVNAEYLKPSRLDDLLTVHTCVRAVHGATVEMEQIVRRDADDLVRMNVTLACINTVGRPVRLPTEVREVLTQFTGNVAGTETEG